MYCACCGRDGYSLCPECEAAAMKTGVWPPEDPDTVRKQLELERRISAVVREWEMEYPGLYVRNIKYSLSGVTLTDVVEYKNERS